MLLPMAKRMPPGLDGAASTRQMGHRPATPDRLPVLGPAGGVGNVLYAFGRGRCGLTMAAVTGEVIADIDSGRETEIDLPPYAVGRFARSAR